MNFNISELIKLWWLFDNSENLWKCWERHRNIYISSFFVARQVFTQGKQPEIWMGLWGLMTTSLFNNATRGKQNLQLITWRMFLEVEKNKYLIRALQTFTDVNLFILFWFSALKLTEIRFKAFFGCENRLRCLWIKIINEQLYSFWQIENYLEPK